MKRFQFSLEALLSLRKEREQECEIALASAVGQLLSIDKRIEEAESAGERAFEASDVSLEALRARERIWLKSRKDRIALEKPRDEAALRVESARKIYTEAHSKKAALEKLRENRMDQWKFQVKQDEIKRLDETAKGAASRRRLTGGEL